MNISDMVTKLLYKIFLQIPKITIDSREDCSGSMFFALKGENFDGNLYAHKAIENGAAYVVVDNPDVCRSEKYLLVNNVLKSLQNLANHHRKQLNIPIIGITGTNGKTTTKELIYSVLGKKYNTHATIGNFNNHIGVPLTLLQISDKVDIAIVEMGANHPGEIDALCQIAEPNYGLITNIGRAHLEGFGSFNGVIKTKSELYNFLKLNNGKVFMNIDNPILKGLWDDDARCMSYGTSENTHTIGKITQTTPYINLDWQTASSKQANQVKSKLVGTYNFENIMAAVCIGNYFEVPPSDICMAISNYTPKNQRSQLKQTGKNTLILDLYNANPSSMEKAIENLAAMKPENPLLILGDMRELGKYAQPEHESIIKLIEEKGFRDVFLVGENFSKYNRLLYFHCFNDVTELETYVNNNITDFENHTILIKGSRGIQLEKVVGLL